MDDPLSLVMAGIFALIGLAVAIGLLAAVVQGIREQIEDRRHQRQLQAQRLRERENEWIDKQLGANDDGQ